QGAQFGLGLDTQDAYGDFKQAVQGSLRSGSFTAFGLRLLAIALDADSVAGALAGAVVASPHQIEEHQAMSRALAEVVREEGGAPPGLTDSELLALLKTENGAATLLPLLKKSDKATSRDQGGLGVSPPQTLQTFREAASKAAQAESSEGQPTEAPQAAGSGFGSWW